MDVNEMNVMANDINNIVIDILIPARCDKKVNEEAFSKLEQILIELKEKIKDSEVVSKKLVHVLFFVYMQLDMEASYCGYDHPLFQRVAKLEGMLSDIFDG